MKQLAFLGALLFLSSALFGLENWPLAEPELRRVFTQSTETGLLAGTDVAGTGTDVVSPDKGEILLIIEPGKNRLQNIPSGLGGIVLLSHDQNLRSALTQFQPSVFLRSKKKVEAGERLGSTLDPTAPRVRLLVFDQQLKTVVNPQMVLPSLPDQRSPLLFDATLTSEDKTTTFSLLRQNRASTGYWTLNVEAADPQALGTRDILKGVFSVNGFHNGTEFFRLAVQALKLTNGKLVFEDTGELATGAAREIRTSERGWTLGNLFITEGTNIIELVITDYAGNESSRTFNLRGGRF